MKSVVVEQGAVGTDSLLTVDADDFNLSLVLDAEVCFLESCLLRLA
jgi:hypothetical protein